MRVNFCSPKTRMVLMDDRGIHLQALPFLKRTRFEVLIHEFDKMRFQILHIEKDVRG